MYIFIFVSLLLNNFIDASTISSEAMPKTEEYILLDNNPMQLDQTGMLWAPYLEWSLTNPNYSGNPYDLIATATFTHDSSGEIRTTPMFYTGSDTWKFRFTGTRTGSWSFTTASKDSNLDGFSGNVVIQPNTNPNIKGFITTYGNKFARQTGENGELEAYIFNVYQDNLHYPSDFWDWTNNRSLDYIRLYPAEQWATEYLQSARNHGANTIFIALANQWLKQGVLTHNGHNSNVPEHLTFDMLERVITTIHQQGGHVHIWVWGDEQRKWTPIGLDGGINGVVDRRLQRYIAARLGPLPGWTMSYGFDLHEWVTAGRVKSWADYLHQQFGWPHLLSAREESSFKSPLNMDILSIDDRPKNNFYNNAVYRLENSSNRPVLFERRFYYYRDNVWDMETTRRALWQFTFAGGAGSWLGIHHSLGRSEPYSNPEQLQTFSRFWEGRFLLGMARANELTDGYALKDISSDNLVFYKENTSSINLNLVGMAGPQPAVAVDTKKAYGEINLGEFNPINHVWDAPYKSDWAIAVGEFNRQVLSEKIFLPAVIKKSSKTSSFDAFIPSTGKVGMILDQTGLETSDLSSSLNYRSVIVGSLIFLIASLFTYIIIKRKLTI
jgi:hypothetical protein